MGMSDTRSFQMNGITFTTWMDYDDEVQVVSAAVEKEDEANLKAAGLVLADKGYDVATKEEYGEGIMRDDLFVLLNARKPLDLSAEERAALGKEPELYVPKGSVEVTEEE